ncbi:MAG: imm11 family protein [Christensenellales bacterium]
MKYYSLIEIDDDIMPVHFKKGELPYPVSDLEDGMKLKHKPQTPTVYLDDDVVLYDWASVVLPVVSKRFLDLILQSNSEGLEYFQVNLIDKNGISHEYYVLNYIPVLKHAMDKKSSKIIKSCCRRLPDSVAIPSIIETATKGLDIFRLEETGFKIFISEKLSKTLKKHKITGLEFCQVRTFNSQEK